MRYRALDADGDMQFGQGAAGVLVDSPEAVAQAVRTRLWLFVGEWFLDVREGMDWRMRVLGANTRDTRDMAIRARILGTPGVRAIVAYVATADAATRAYTVHATIETDFGLATLTEAL